MVKPILCFERMRVREGVHLDSVRMSVYRKLVVTARTCMHRWWPSNLLCIRADSNRTTARPRCPRLSMYASVREHNEGLRHWPHLLQFVGYLIDTTLLYDVTFSNGSSICYVTCCKNIHIQRIRDSQKQTTPTFFPSDWAENQQSNPK